MVSPPKSGIELWPGHCVVFLDKTLYSYSASLHHPEVEMGTGELSGKPNEKPGGGGRVVTCDGLAFHPRESRNTPNRFMLRKPG